MERGLIPATRLYSSQFASASRCRLIPVERLDPSVSRCDIQLECGPRIVTGISAGIGASPEITDEGLIPRTDYGRRDG